VLQKLHHAQSDVGLDGRDGGRFRDFDGRLHSILTHNYQCGQTDRPGSRGHAWILPTQPLFSNAHPCSVRSTRILLCTGRIRTRASILTLRRAADLKLSRYYTKKHAASQLQRERVARDAEATQQAQQHTGTSDAPKKRSVDEPPVVELAKKKKPRKSKSRKAQSEDES
jgi:hypothetical protein